MQFVIVEILACLVAASVLGALIGWSLKTVTGRKRHRSTRREMSSRIDQLQLEHQQALSEEAQSRQQLEAQCVALQNKVRSLETSLDGKEQALFKSGAEVQSLRATIEAHEAALQEARDSTEELVLEYTSAQHRLQQALTAKEHELNTLRIADGTGGSYAKAALDDPATQARIDELNVRKQRLIQEREKLIERERHFSEQLTLGDDTRAYFDDTIRLEPQDEELSLRDDAEDTQLIDNANTSTTDDTSADEPPPSGSNTPPTGRGAAVTDRAPDTPVLRTVVRSGVPPTADEVPDTSQPRSLWDRVRSKVVKHSV